MTVRGSVKMDAEDDESLMALVDDMDYSDVLWEEGKELVEYLDFEEI